MPMWCSRLFKSSYTDSSCQALKTESESDTLNLIDTTVFDFITLPAEMNGYTIYTRDMNITYKLELLLYMMQGRRCTSPV